MREADTDIALGIYRTVTETGEHQAMVSQHDDRLYEFSWEDSTEPLVLNRTELLAIIVSWSLEHVDVMS